MPSSRLFLSFVVAFLGFASLACGLEGDYCESMFDCGDGLDCVDGTCTPYGASPSEYGSGTCGGEATGSYDYTYTCDYTGDYTVPVPDDDCSSASEYYARAFGCNEISEMYDACLAYASCYCYDTSTCDSYAG